MTLKFATGLLVCCLVLAESKAQTTVTDSPTSAEFQGAFHGESLFVAPRSELGVDRVLRDWTVRDGRLREFSSTADELSWRLRRTTRREARLDGFGGASAVVWDEDHFDSRDRGWGAETAFEQNRTFAGLKWRLHPSSPSSLEFGYLNQTWDEPGQDDRRLHFWSFNFHY